MDRPDANAAVRRHHAPGNADTPADTAANVPVEAPAGFRRRYAAWSLDFAAVGALATLFTWSRLVAGAQRVAAAWDGLSGQLGQRVVDGLMSGTPPKLLADALQHDAAIRAAADGFEKALFAFGMPWLLAYALIGAAWHLGGERSPWQASPGKHALGLRVVRSDGGRAGALQLAWRYLACSLSWLSLNLGHLLAAVTRSRRTLHDLLAGTMVSRDADAGPLPGWARAWLWTQAALLVGGTAWVLWRYVQALQAGLGLG